MRKGRRFSYPAVQSNGWSPDFTTETPRLHGGEVRGVQTSEASNFIHRFQRNNKIELHHDVFPQDFAQTDLARSSVLMLLTSKILQKPSVNDAKKIRKLFIWVENTPNLLDQGFLISNNTFIIHTIHLSSSSSHRLAAFHPLSQCFNSHFNRELNIVGHCSHNMLLWWIFLYFLWMIFF